MSALRKTEPRYTYTEYAQFDFGDEKWELIDGEVYAMASPVRTHQKISHKITRRIEDYLDEKKKRCEVVQDFDTRLNYAKGDDIVFRPDVVVVCGSSRIDENSVKGAPDMVVEILSPSTAKTDLNIKFAKYKEVGVKEIWHIHPETKLVQVTTLQENGTYETEYYGDDDNVPVSIFPEFFINCEDIFPLPIEEDNTNEDS